jgi:predicted acyltransferase (DUF342 family)
MIKTKKPELRKQILVDRRKKLMIVKKNAVIDRKIRFNGKILVGMDACLWGDVECEEINTSKGVFIKGKVSCKKAVLGANTEFKWLKAEEAIIQNGCRGEHLEVEKAIIRKNVSIGNLEAETAYLDGISTLGKVNAKRVIASKSE